MARTVGAMVTLTTYGTWLRGDRRGWVDHGIVYPPNPPVEDADRRRMAYPAFLFDRSVRHRVGQTLGEAFIKRMQGRVFALTVRSWHVHAVVGFLSAPISQQVKCLKDAARWALRLQRPIWSGGLRQTVLFRPQCACPTRALRATTQR